MATIPGLPLCLESHLGRQKKTTLRRPVYKERGLYMILPPFFRNPTCKGRGEGFRGEQRSVASTKIKPHKKSSCHLSFSKKKKDLFTNRYWFTNRCCVITMSFSKTTVNSDLIKCGACLLTGACLPIYFYLCFVFEDDTGQQLLLRFYFFLSLPLASDVGPVMSEVTEGKSPVPVLTEGRSPVPVLTEGKSPMPVPELPAFLDPKSEAHFTHLLCHVMTHSSVLSPSGSRRFSPLSLLLPPLLPWQLMTNQTTLPVSRPSWE